MSKIVRSFLKKTGGKVVSLDKPKQKRYSHLHPDHQEEIKKERKGKSRVK